MRRALPVPLCAILALCALLPRATASEKEFLSVKPARVLVREEPESDGKRLWPMWKYSPVEVLSYRGDWVRVRDFEGDAGWLRKAELCEIPTVAVVRKDAPLRKTPARDGKVLWLLEKGYALRVFGAKGEWLEVSDLDAANGWILAEDVWGFPPPEASAAQ